MQSYLQFRKFGKSVDEEHERNKVKIQQGIGRNRTRITRPSTSSDDSSSDSSSGSSVRSVKEAVETPDLEKCEDSSDGLPQDEEVQDIHGERLPRGVYVADRHEMAERDDMTILRATTTNNSNLQRRQTQTQANPQQPQDLSQALSMIATTRTQQSTNTALGHSLTGINVRGRTTHEGQKGGLVFVVGYQGANDPSNPHNWGMGVRIMCTFLIASIGFVVGFASAIDSSALTHAAAEFGVSEVAESLATGMLLFPSSCLYKMQ
jgi:hypothetical protein